MRAAAGRTLIGAALAATAPAFAAQLGGSVALTSDYVYEGLSRTCGGPAAQADAHASGTGAVATFGGVWGSAGIGGTYCHAAREVDIYLGQRWALDASNTVAIRYVHYGYPGGTYLYERIEGHRLDYDELRASWAFEDRIQVSLGWTPNAAEYQGYHVVRGRSAVNFGAEFHQPLGRWFTLSAGAGYDQVSDLTGAGYTFWSAGISRPVGPIALDLSYFGTAPRAERLFGSQVAGNRVAATALWRF
jgi:uncharacterized protein (TIGR02001 family)